MLIDDGLAVEAAVLPHRRVGTTNRRRLRVADWSLNVPTLAGERIARLRGSTLGNRGPSTVHDRETQQQADQTDQDSAHDQFLHFSAAYPWNRMSPTIPAKPITYGSLSFLK